MSSAATGAAGRSRQVVAAGLQRLWARGITWLLAYLPERSKVRRPAVRIHTAAAVPGVVVRLAIAGIGVVCASAVVVGPPGWVMVSVLLVGLCCAPGTVVGGALVMVLGVLLVFDPAAGPVWRTPLLVAAVPLLMQLAAIAGQAGWTARIELRVLALPLRRYLAIQVFAQLLALAGAQVAGLGYVLPQVMAVAAVAVLALVAFWLPTLGPERRRDS